MKTRAKQIFVFALLMSLISAPLFADNKYFSDPDLLPKLDRYLYQEAMSTLDNWRGRRENLDTAYGIIGNVIASQPEFLPIYIELARHTIMFGYMPGQDFSKELGDAEAILLDIVKKDETYPKAYVLLGHVYTKMQKLPEAKAALSKADRLGTQDPWLYYNWADLYLTEGKNVQAGEKAMMALRTGTDNIKAISAALNILGDSYVSKSDSALRKELLGAFKKAGFGYEELVRIANSVLNSYKGNDNAIKIARIIIGHLLELDESDLSANILLARYELKAGYMYNQFMVLPKYEEDSAREAEKILLALKNKGERDPRIYSLLLDVYFSDIDLNKIEATLKEADYNKVISPSIELSKAQYYCFRKEYDKAIPIYEAIVEEQSEYSYAASAGLLNAYDLAGYIDKAEKMYLDALEREPVDAWEHGNYAMFILSHRDDVDKAIKHAEKALSIINYGIGRKILARAYYIKWAKIVTESGNSEEVAAYLKKAGALGLELDEMKVNRNCTSYCEIIQKARNITHI